MLHPHHWEWSGPPGLRSPQTREEGRGRSGVPCVGVAELGPDLALLSMRQAHVHPHEDREHRERQDRRPLDQEPQHDQDEPRVVGVAHVRTGARGGQPVGLLGRVEHPPGGCQQDESSGDEDIAQQVQRVQVWVTPPPQQRFPEVSTVVRQKIDPGVAPLKPSREPGTASAGNRTSR